MLVEEANLSIVQEALVPDDHVELKFHNIRDEMELKEANTDKFPELAPGFLDRGSENDALPSSSCPEPEKPVLSSPECPNGVLEVVGSAAGIPNAVNRIEGANTYIDYQAVAPNTEQKEGAAVEMVHELQDHESGSVLQACNSNFSHQDKSLIDRDTQCPSAVVAEVTVCEGQTSELAPNGLLQTRPGELLDQFYIEALKDQFGHGNLDPPTPEKLLSISDSGADEQKNPLLESTPNKEDLEVGMKQISGRKRSLTESAATMQSNSLEFFGWSQSKRTVELVPDDDDLLSSILVGRMSSVLKMKPTPAPLGLISSKRPRTGQCASAFKRKVLMDETMVLLGE
ncbi:hypothetical protein SAY86_028727 [Trapa natans]|uniref:Uncharacterized protein n=1 Tax=Trapa natans TaxID=22666 RepID=A0AAN7MIY1_TRANT|nr:hypothetical protein SAY86_028727 [Trapa natans]